MKQKWREGTTSASRGYGYRWQKARESYLNKHPLCTMCQQVGRVTAATVVDHKVPHRGDSQLFWDQGNWQPLCAECHSSTKQRMEKRGVDAIGHDVTGAPLSAQHHWNSGR